MTHPKVSPDDLPLFQQLVTRAKSDGSGSVTQADYQQLERDFIAAQGTPRSPAFLWGWGHQRLLREALAAAGVRVRHLAPAVLHPYVLDRTGFSRLRELESKMSVKDGDQRV